MMTPFMARLCFYGLLVLTPLNIYFSVDSLIEGDYLWAVLSGAIAAFGVWVLYMAWTLDRETLL